jgi:BMFP domain-containing protein YqiC
MDFSYARAARLAAVQRRPLHAQRRCSEEAVNRRPGSRIEMNEKLLSELSARLSQMAAANPARDLERNMRALLASTFARLDLVTREEYDVQVQVLARARERLAALEARIAELEARKPS